MITFLNCYYNDRLRDHLRIEEGRTILTPTVKEISVEIFFTCYVDQLHLV
jgi:hypothetical protein